MPTYVLSNAWEAERRRLHLLEVAYDPASRARILALGVRPDARCLEMGAGGGSMAAWFADVVASSGTAVAADLDPRHVEPQAAVRPNLEARRHELLADPMPERGFDFALTRRRRSGHRSSVARRQPARSRWGGHTWTAE